MGMLSRMSTIVKSKINRVLDDAEDPRETLDYSYEKQREMLRNVKRGVVEMVTAKRRLELQANKAEANIAKLDSQARQALGAGREDLARLALERKQTTINGTAGAGRADLGAGARAGQADPCGAAAPVEGRRPSARRRRSSRPSTALPRPRSASGRRLGGISEEMGDVTLAVERAQTKTENLQAKAGAIDELVADRRPRRPDRRRLAGQPAQAALGVLDRRV